MLWLQGQQQICEVKVNLNPNNNTPPKHACIHACMQIHPPLHGWMDEKHLNDMYHHNSDDVPVCDDCIMTVLALKVIIPALAVDVSVLNGTYLDLYNLLLCNNHDVIM